MDDGRIVVISRACLCLKKNWAMSRTMTVEEFAPLILGGGVDLIDVRTMMEFFEIHAVGALCAPLDTLNPRVIMESRGARAGEPLYIICRSGGRSQQACQVFEGAGYTNVVSIEGGTLEWVKAGLPVNRGRKKMMSLERQVRICAGLLTLFGSMLAIISLWFLILPAVVGTDLAVAGLRNRCGMGMILAKAPWNRSLTAGGCGGGGCSQGSCS
jgi:rhodanese-related sulfurtransferase